MTDIEKELINTIRESENPEIALLTAIDIVATFLKQPLSYQVPFVDSQRGLA